MVLFASMHMCMYVVTGRVECKAMDVTTPCCLNYTSTSWKAVVMSVFVSSNAVHLMQLKTVVWGTAWLFASIDDSGTT